MDLLAFSQIINHKSRLSIIMALMGGKALPASELAYRAGVTNQTISSHLNKLLQHEFVKVRKCGRHRYYELINSEFAAEIENLATKIDTPSPSRSAHKEIATHLRKARFCYDHFAGKLGTNITQSLLQQSILRENENDFSIIEPEHPLFVKLDINLQTVKKQRRKFAPTCLDWSERTPHLAGSLGAAIAKRFIQKNWVIRSKDDRSVTLTEAGHLALQEIFLIDQRNVD